jgi:hypothetical protein
MFNLPDESDTFYEDMCYRAYQYVRIKYWDIDEDLLTLWLKNFSNDHEKFLCAILIYRLLYRNEQAQLSMYKHIIDMVLPSLLSKYDIYHVETLDEFHKDLISHPHKLNFRFSTIEDIDGKTAKSGHAVLRLFQRRGRFHKNLEVSKAAISSLPPSVKAIILFDDFMGTGEQFDAYLTSLEDSIESLIFIYCPLAAHEEGIEYIKSKYKDVIIVPVETLSYEYTFIDEKFMPKIAENIDMGELKTFYIDFLRSKTKLTKDFFGRKDQGLLYCFSSSTPNNSLPIFSYYDENFNMIFPR